MKITQYLYKWQYVMRQWIVRQQYRFFPVRCKEISLPPRRVLFIISGLLGDSVMSSPVLKEARRLWPNAQLTLLGQKHNLELLAACPYLDAFHETKALPFSLRQRAEIKKLTEWITQAQFDLAIILLGDQFAPLLAEAEIPVRVGVKGHVLEPCLTHTYDIKSPREWGPPERLNALRCLGYEVPDSVPQLVVKDEAREIAMQKLLDFGLPLGSQYCVIHPFGSTQRQWWDLRKTDDLARRLAHQHGLSTVLIGGKETQQAASDADLQLINTTGKLSLQELMAAIERAEFVISSDSGPFHIAGALGRPLIGLFRDRRPEHARRYRQTNVVFGLNDQCSNSCAWDKCFYTHCRQMAALSENEVWLQIVSTIAASQRAVAASD